MARRLSDSSRFSPPRAFLHRCSLPRLFIFPGEQGRTAQVTRRERGKKTRGGAILRVWSWSGVLGQLGRPRCRVVCGMPRCLTSHLETSHAKRHKREAARGGSRAHARHNMRGTTKKLARNPLERRCKSPWTAHSAFFAHSSRYPAGRRYRS